MSLVYLCISYIPLSPSPFPIYPFSPIAFSSFAPLLYLSPLTPADIHVTIFKRASSWWPRGGHKNGPWLWPRQVVPKGVPAAGLEMPWQLFWATSGFSRDAWDAQGGGAREWRGGGVLKSLSSEFGALNLLNVELRIPCMHLLSMCCKLMFCLEKTSIYNTCS